ncbi:SulP family inorganic anion transporter [Kordiimonas marina]|uniref:SulP family inorganic anion transporter n=1 Tax=Kordiimonas marina TaxID=2872312 RepID=UPI001FF4BA89|nr:SulP family inorganic anion transporter [Kordiimonas marina]MCJ9430504.1 SulP family inorganic anion transporter [Kordiimonas marina]
MDNQTVSRSRAGAYFDLFLPKLITVFREGYGLSHLRADIISGLTVAIVALPLSMAIAIASGVAPERGLYAAIFGGVLVSALGGSRFQIGGPAGAFIILVAATGARHGIDGLLLTTLMAGVFLLAIGFLQLGTYIKFIPYPVTVGFTAGIAVIIFASQVSSLLGLQITGAEPGPILKKLPVLWHALPTFDGAATAVAALSVLIILGLKRWQPRLPGMLIAVGVAAALTAGFSLDIQTIGSKFGGIPSSLPMPHLPTFTLAKAQAVLPDAIAFALLGAIESLLSAVVADGMSGRRHRSNCELVAQGAANIASALFGGLCVTGTIARTATNVRAGAHGPISGIVHSITLAVFILVAAPLAAYIPLAALAAVLAVVAWNMIERHAIAILMRASKGEALAFFATFGLTVFRDLTEAILVGFSIAALVFIHRMSRSTEIEMHMPVVEEDAADAPAEDRQPYNAAYSSENDVVIYRISGAFFFGAASMVGAVLDRINDPGKALVLDLSAVPFLDATAANTIAAMAARIKGQGIQLAISGARSAVRHDLLVHGVRPPSVIFKPSIKQAVAAIRARRKDSGA